MLPSLAGRRGPDSKNDELRRFIYCTGLVLGKLMIDPDLAELTPEVQREVARLDALRREALVLPLSETENQETDDQRARWAAVELRDARYQVRENQS